MNQTNQMNQMNQTNQMNQPEQPEMNLNERHLRELQNRAGETLWFRRYFSEKEKLELAYDDMENTNYIERHTLEHRRVNGNYLREIRENMMNRDLENDIIYNYFKNLIKDMFIDNEMATEQSVEALFLKFRDGYKISKNRHNDEFNKINFNIICEILRDVRIIESNNLGRNLTEVDLLVKYYQLFNYPRWFAHKVGGITNPHLMTSLLY